MIGKLAQSILLAVVLLPGPATPVAAQSDADTTSSDFERYWWVTGGIGVGGFGTGYAVTGGVPLTDHVFFGGRFTSFKEVRGLFPSVSPREKIWNVGPLVGILLTQGRYGQLSLASGLVMGAKRRRTQPKPPEEQPDPCGWFCTTETRYDTEKVFRAGIPLNTQFFFTPIRFVGIGLETGFTVMLPKANPALDLSVQVTVRLPAEKA